MVLCTDLEGGEFETTMEELGIARAEVGGRQMLPTSVEMIRGVKTLKIVYTVPRRRKTLCRVTNCMPWN